MFSKKQIRNLLIPLMIEQILTSLMGTVDTMMVASVGSIAVSAVSLVDVINVLIIYIFTAVAAGGTIVCAQYLGRKDIEGANQAGQQLILSTTMISMALMIFFIVFRGWLLRTIFGEVESAVMENSMKYLLITSLSYPFVALYNAGAALFRVEGNSRLPMVISTISNIVNVVGNALLIFVFKMGVTGAATATLVSKIICAVAIMVRLRQPNQCIVVKDYLNIRPDRSYIGKIMRVGIPSGIENGMFQFGKLAIQSSIATLGTTAIAGHAMAASVELLTSNAQMGIGYGLMTIVGQCIGSGKVEEAKGYILKLTHWAEITTIAVSALFALLIRPLTIVSGMEQEAADLTVRMIYVISVVKVFLWTWAYIPAFGMRAAGDVKYSMIASTAVMWICRVLATTIMIRVLHWGIMAAWYGMFMDWAVKSTLFYLRFRSKKWAQHQLIS